VVGSSHTSLVARWRARTTSQRRAVAQYLHRVQLLVAIWAETLAEITDTGALDIMPHITRLLALWRWLDQVEIPPGGAAAHAALIDALEQTLMACGAILTGQPREAVVQARDAALTSFEVYQTAVMELVGAEPHLPSSA
jgi:hypothetical protein